MPAFDSTTSRVIIGESFNRRPILATRFAGTSGETVLLLAGIHGDERSTVAVMERFAAAYAEHVGDPDGPTVVIVPIANPDGFAANTRVNARGVDLNRNFPAKNFKPSQVTRYANGPSPLSEPESKALLDLVESIRPARILSLHSIRPPKHGNNYDGPGESLAELLAVQNHYAVLSTIGYPTPGSFGSWAGIDRQIPTITLELPSTMTADCAWAENHLALFAFVRGR